jgi:hypothetical protein
MSQQTAQSPGSHAVLDVLQDGLTGYDELRMNDNVGL